MLGSVHFKSDRGQWVVAWTWKGKRYQISRYKGQLMAQTHPKQEKDQGYKNAHRLLAQMQGDVENGVFRIEKYTGDRYTDVIPFYEQWLQTKAGKKPGTIKLYRSLFECHIKPWFEANPVQLHEIQLDTLDSIIASLKIGRSSAHLCMQVFRAFLDYAWRSKRIPEMPPFPKKGDYGIETPTIQWLPEARQMAVIEAIPAEHRLIFLFLKYHLRRPAEAMALHKMDYDRINSAFIIRRSISAGKLTTSTKTRAEHIIPCHRAMVADIERIIDDPGQKSPFMFTNRRGRTADKRYTEKVLNRLWADACKEVGESIEMYSGLKHSSMSQYTNEKNMGMAELQIISGHKNIASVYKYADVALARKRELMEALSVVEVPEKIRKAK